MWARDVEVMLGVWLALSPFIFRHEPDAKLLWVSDLVSALLVATFALLSYWRPTRHAHLLTIAVALWLIGFGRFGASVPLPWGMQNDIVIGLLLLMFAVVPNEAAIPPSAWRRGDELAQ
jgi:hypothetical protein